MTTPRPRGRPRDEDTDRRILTEALNLMGRVGYARMAVDDVATAAGTTRATIYLRYPSKVALAMAALVHARQDAPQPSHTGDTLADLTAQLRHFQDGVTAPYGLSMIGALLAEEHATPELLAVYRERVVIPRRLMIRSVLEEGQARGEFVAEADIDLAVAELIGSFYALYIAGEPIPSDWPERVSRQVLSGLWEISLR